MKPIHHIKDAVNNGTWVPNQIRDNELIEKLSRIIDNLKK
jgi:hypothetical protein